MKSPFHQSPKPLEIVPRCRQSATAWVTPRQPNAKYPMNSETVRVGTEMVNQHVLSTSIDVLKIIYNNHIYIYGGCPKLLFPQRPLGPSLRQPCAFLARPHSRITFIISVVFHHYSRTCFRMLNI